MQIIKKYITIISSFLIIFIKLDKSLVKLFIVNTKINLNQFDFSKIQIEIFIVQNIRKIIKILKIKKYENILIYKN